MSVSGQYATDDNLRARQRLWAVSNREPAFDLQTWVLELAQVRPDDRILEVGCGNGAYLARIPAVGLDISVGMLRSAKKHALGPLVCGNAERLPFDDHTFDVVLAPHMLYHVADRPRAIGELRRVLKNGRLCIAVTNSGRNQPELVALVEGAVGGGWKWLRRSTAGFSLENGAIQLSRSFPSVSRIDCPAGHVSITDSDALAAYLLSLETEYESEFPAGVSWREAVEVCRQRVKQQVAAEGRFVVTQLVGAFVCR